MYFLMNVLASSTAKKDRNFFSIPLNISGNQTVIFKRIAFPLFHKWNHRFNRGSILNVKTSFIKFESWKLVAFVASSGFFQSLNLRNNLVYF